MNYSPRSLPYFLPDRYVGKHDHQTGSMCEWSTFLCLNRQQYAPSPFNIIIFGSCYWSKNEINFLGDSPSTAVSLSTNKLPKVTAHSAFLVRYGRPYESKGVAGAWENSIPQWSSQLFDTMKVISFLNYDWHGEAKPRVLLKPSSLSFTC